ncbi:MAG: O-antigen ligase family protein [candidate division Zixibacteria bacterium]|nr:O-antigen ligase family protein [candidate division Zixibacteria bacterium]MCI0596064.1 O-antigen ligase family protein [candidate division Zixibacteria bacterium]
MGAFRQLLWWGEAAGCYLFVFFSPFWISAAEAGFALALVCWVFDWLFEFPRPFPASFLIFPTIVFFAMLLVSAIFGLSFSHSLVFISKQWVFLGIFFFVLRFRDEQIRRKAFVLLGISTGLVALYSILQSFAGWDFNMIDPMEPLGKHFRARGFFNVKLVFGLYFSLTALVFMALGWPKRKEALGRFFLSAAALSYLAVLFGAVRAGLLALVAGLVLYLLLSLEKQKAYMVGGAALLTLAAWGANPALFSRFELVQRFDVQAGNPESRASIWRKSWEIFQEQPVLGVGPGNFRQAYGPKIKGLDTTFYGHAHNEFLNMLVFCGLFGLAAFLFFWKELVWRIWTNFRQNRASPYLLTGVLAAAAYFAFTPFESALVHREVRMILFLLLGAALAARENNTG